MTSPNASSSSPRRSRITAALFGLAAMTGLTACAAEDAQAPHHQEGDAHYDNEREGAPCVGRAPAATAKTESAASVDEAAPEYPDALPLWRLEDFQPQSCGYGETYGADAFEGNVVLAAMLAGWCSYCQSQAGYLERMRNELAAEGITDVTFIAVNGVTAESAEDQQKLVDRCAFPLFQDVTKVGAWNLHAARKDDIFIYDRDGNLAESMASNDAELNTKLSSEEGYAQVKAAIMRAREK